MANKDNDTLIGTPALASMHDTKEYWTDISDAQVPSTQMATDSSPTPRIALESTQAIQNVVELHERLLRALEHGDKIEIDASAVQQIDTASLQLLLVMKRSAITLLKEVSIDFPSERFIEAATLLGLAEMLEVDHAAAGFF